MTEHCVATIPAGFEAFADDGFDDTHADSWAMEAFAAERAPARAAAARHAANSSSKRAARSAHALPARGAFWWVLAGVLALLALV